MELLIICSLFNGLTLRHQPISNGIPSKIPHCASAHSRIHIQPTTVGQEAPPNGFVESGSYVTCMIEKMRSVSILLNASIVIVYRSTLFWARIGGNGSAVVIDKTHRANLAKVILVVLVPVTRDFSINTSVSWALSSAGGKTTCFEPLWEELEKDTVVALARIASATLELSVNTHSSVWSLRKGRTSPIILMG